MMELFEDKTEERAYFESWMIHPDKIATMEALRSRDQNAERAIREAEREIEKLKEYRQMLYKRAQILDRAEKRKLVEIIRTKKDDRVIYTVSVYDVAQDGTRHGYETEFYHRSITGSMKVLLKDEYSGKDRRTAIENYEQLVKDYPGAMTIDRRDGWKK